MTDSEFEVQKKRIDKMSSRWLKQLGLGWWKVTLVYSRERKAGEREGESSLADTWARWQYLEADIKFYIPAIKELDDNGLEQCFVHECMHIFLHEVREDGIDHEERVATQLAIAFLWIRKEGFEEGGGKPDGNEGNSGESPKNS